MTKKRQGIASSAVFYIIVINNVHIPLYIIDSY